jgi:hypothetical protein
LKIYKELDEVTIEDPDNGMDDLFDKALLNRLDSVLQEFRSIENLKEPTINSDALDPLDAISDRSNSESPEVNLSTTVTSLDWTDSIPVYSETSSKYTYSRKQRWLNDDELGSDPKRLTTEVADGTKAGKLDSLTRGMGAEFLGDMNTLAEDAFAGFVF